ncbi:MAG TPA: RodZ domain-containing protein [Burkholderiales bacterium]|nr:RodZ domain-containing protein [Burkholderiales bacterium]
MNASVEPAIIALHRGEVVMSPLGVGQQLAQARQILGLSVGEVARHLKLSVRQVEALEADAYERFSSLLFVRGYLRNYARLVRLDLESQISRIRPPGSAEPAPRRIASDLQQHSRLPSARTVLLGAVLAGVITVFVVVHQTGREATQARDFERNEVLTNPTAPPASRGAHVPRAQSSQRNGAAARPSQAETKGASGSIKGGQTAGAAAAVAPTTRAALGAQQASGSPAHLSHSSAAEVKLQFDAAAWVEVKDAAGRIVFSRLSKPGSEEVVAGDGPLTLVVRNARHVHVVYQGQAVDLSPHTRFDVARLILQ